MTLDLGTLGQNPPDPDYMFGWNTDTPAPPAYFSPDVGYIRGYSFQSVAAATDPGLLLTQWNDRFPVAESSPARPTTLPLPPWVFVGVPDRRGIGSPTGFDHPTPDRNWTYVPWPDDAHQIEDATWIHDARFPGLGWDQPLPSEFNEVFRPGTQWEPAGQVSYVRHVFWVPNGTVTSPPSLEFKAVDLAREVWLNGTLVYSTNEDYNTAFADYAGHTIEVDSSLLLPGQWNLLAFKIQHHVNVIDRVIGPWWNNRQPYDLIWDVYAPADEQETFALIDVPDGATQMSVQMLAAFLGQWTWNDIPNPEHDLVDSSVFGFAEAPYFRVPLWLPIDNPRGPEDTYYQYVSTVNSVDVTDPTELDATGELSSYWVFDRLWSP